jgi:death on curing protein
VTNEDQDEPRRITEGMLLAIHARQIERYGGAHGVIDANVVGSARARPLHRWAYDDDVDLADLAAAYLVGFSRSQGFRDGNKRTGLACALVFLALNGRELHVPPKELYALCMQAATGKADDEVVARYLRERLTPCEQ